MLKKKQEQKQRQKALLMQLMEKIKIYQTKK
jgi:hypothetical protein